jgi:hypothetical protein
MGGPKVVARQCPLMAASGDSLKLPIAAVGVVSLGRERQLTGAGANSHYRPTADLAGYISI